MKQNIIEFILLTAVIVIALVAGLNWGRMVAKEERREMLECLAGLDSRCSVSSVYADHRVMKDKNPE